MINHLTVLCFVVWPLNKSEPGVVLVLIEISLPFFCKFVLISMRETSSWLQLLCFVIGLKVSRQFFSQLEAKPKPISPWTHDVFPALWATYKWCLGILIGSSRCSFLLWLIVVITWFWFFDSHLKTALSCPFFAKDLILKETVLLCQWGSETLAYEERTKLLVRDNNYSCFMFARVSQTPKNAYIFNPFVFLPFSQ